MPSYLSIPPILRWLSWLTPVAYAFEGLMLNEFSDLQFESDLIGVSGNTVSPVEIGGNQWLTGYNLPRSAFSGTTGIKVFDIFMVFLFALVYDTLGFHFIEKTRTWYHHQIRRPQATVKKSFGIGSNRNRLRLAVASDSQVNNANEDSSWPSSLIAKNISYEVPLKTKSAGINIRKTIRKMTTKFAGKKVSASINDEADSDRNSWVQNEPAQSTIRLLDHVDVHFRRGRMTCLMGTSGAGKVSYFILRLLSTTYVHHAHKVTCYPFLLSKTTLLDVIAGYKTGGTITGDILIDGRVKDPLTWRKISGYAEQQDILNPYLSVLETLRFTANCRLPRSVDKESVIQRVLSLMDLEEWSDHIIGREKDGE